MRTLIVVSLLALLAVPGLAADAPVVLFDFVTGEPEIGRAHV